MRWAAFIALVVACVAARGEDPILHDFDGVSSLAAALRKSDFEVQEDAAALGVVVKGPNATDQARPLMAEVRHRIERLDVMAGLQADRTAISAGPSKWVGGVGMAAEHGRGRESLEVRTDVGQNEQWGRIGLEVGPRIERRLPGGITLFFDGKAEAASTPWRPYGGQPLPGTSDGLGLIGITGRTGLVR
ncbi:hypothetical protein EBR56_10085 [bacterium]|nr:hypothetical protein [bacterium]